MVGLPRREREIFFRTNHIIHGYRVFAIDQKTYIRLMTDWDTEIPPDLVEDLIKAFDEARPIRAAQRAEVWRDRTSRTQETYITIRERPFIRVVIGWGIIYLGIEDALVGFDGPGIDELIQLLTDPPTVKEAYRQPTTPIKYRRDRREVLYELRRRKRMRIRIYRNIRWAGPIRMPRMRVLRTRVRGPPRGKMPGMPGMSEPARSYAVSLLRQPARKHRLEPGR